MDDLGGNFVIGEGEEGAGLLWGFDNGRGLLGEGVRVVLAGSKQVHKQGVGVGLV